MHTKVTKEEKCNCIFTYKLYNKIKLLCESEKFDKAREIMGL